MDNEPVFRNKCVYTKKVLLEMARKSMNTLTLVLFIAVICITLAGAILLFWTGKAFDAAVALLVALVYSALLIILPIASSNKQYKRFVTTYRKEVEMQISFYDDHFVSHDVISNGDLDIAYSRLVKIKQTQNLYLLCLDQQLIIIIDKRGFEMGDPDAFAHYVCGRATNAKIRL